MMIKRKKMMTKFNLLQKVKMIMENLIFKKRMIPLLMNYWDYLVMEMMIVITVTKKKIWLIFC